MLNELICESVVAISCRLKVLNRQSKIPNKRRQIPILEGHMVPMTSTECNRYSIAPPDRWHQVALVSANGSAANDAALHPFQTSKFSSCHICNRFSLYLDAHTQIRVFVCYTYPLESISSSDWEQPKLVHFTEWMNKAALAVARKVFYLLYLQTTCASERAWLIRFDVCLCVTSLAPKTRSKKVALSKVLQNVSKFRLEKLHIFKSSIL